jgi:hypothetical protein
MSSITHLLASWSLADGSRLRARDLTLATWCGVLPDADGLGRLAEGPTGCWACLCRNQQQTLDLLKVAGERIEAQTLLGSGQDLEGTRDLPKGPPA